MIIRKPTTITLKPEDDQMEYEEFKKQQESRKQQILKKETIGQFHNQLVFPNQLLQNARRGIKPNQQEISDLINDPNMELPTQIPATYLFRMFHQQQDHE